MSELASAKSTNEDHIQTVPIFGYELIREVLLHDLLGNEAPEILYWAGKRIARMYPLETAGQIAEFFINAGWGNISVVNESKHEIEMELSSQLIEDRCKKNNNCTFQLEAGFIAQQIEFQKEVICEAFEHTRKKNGKILITVKWDKKDPAE
ncbi:MULTISPECIES: YslB family protein [Cytobacillus]|uniref:YslB family protein n=1 Tax=Cytobacillus TaxID=2675230 RepID=UPI00203FA188|nr:YslB family protein [Cytobacillus firmus]MCM3704494.1 YslB family protein [Cytobacillus firmus]